MKYPLLALALLCTTAYAQTVSNIQGFYRSGQVFLTWNKINDNTAFYKVYRSTSPITSGDQLATCEYLGYTNSNSSINHNLTNSEGTLRYLRLDSAASALNSTTGLFVATTLVNGNYYYGVTTLINNVENTTITSGNNSLDNSIAETVATPLPVYQLQKLMGPYPIDIYTNFVSSKYDIDEPMQLNAGFVTYDFAVNLNNATGNNPVRFFFHGGGATYTEDVGVAFGDEVRIQIEDYFPDSTISSAWWGSNPAYDVYNAANNVPPTTGINRNFSQQRITSIIDWVIHHLPVDSTRIYLDATSDGSGPAFFYAITYPEKIAAVRVHGGSFNFSFLNDWMPNCSLNPGKKNRKEGDNRLGTVETNLMCNLGIHTWEAFNGGWMIHAYPEKDYPVIYSINGKNDKQTGWTEKTIFYDSVDANHLGGYFFWDNRDHGGETGKTWVDNFDLYRYHNNISYPAFSFCSLNEDFGDGNGLTGENYGTLNGPLDWSDNITDEEQTWVVKTFVRDLEAQDNAVIVYPDSCTASVTPRRLQHFNPAPGAIIDWQVTHQGTTVQSGSFTYEGGLIVIPQVKIFRDTSTISLTINQAPTATITPSGTLSVCKGLSVTLTANTGTGLQYQWKKNGNNISGATLSTYITSSNDKGSFTVVVTNTVGSSATSAPTTINRLNQPPATITPQGDLDICVTGQVTLQANGGSGLTYQWVKGSANISGATAQTYVATKKASYKVILTNSNNGCSKTSGATKVIKSCRLGDEDSDIPETEISIQPIPNNGNFQMEFRNFVSDDSYGENGRSGMLSIYDVSGRKLFQEQVEITGNEFSREIRLSDAVQDGVYFVEFLVAGNKMVKMMVVSKSNP